MRGARAGGPPASSNRGERRHGRALPGSADREGHGRLMGEPTLRIESSVRGGAAMRRGYVLLIAIAVAIVMFHEFTSMFAGGHVHGGDGVGAARRRRGARHRPGVGAPGDRWPARPWVRRCRWPPRPRAGITDARATRRCRASGPDARARANGLTWGAVAVLGVHFTGEAFDVVPGGHSLAAIVLGAGLGIGTFRLHRHAIEHEAYRTFNLIAMLLAVGSLASMSITPTGDGGRTTSAPWARPTTSPRRASTSRSSSRGREWPRCPAALTRAVADPRFGYASIRPRHHARPHRAHRRQPHGRRRRADRRRDRPAQRRRARRPPPRSRCSASACSSGPGACPARS